MRPGALAQWACPPPCVTPLLQAFALPAAHRSVFTFSERPASPFSWRPSLPGRELPLDNAPVGVQHVEALGPRQAGEEGPAAAAHARFHQVDGDAGEAHFGGEVAGGPRPVPAAFWGASCLSLGRRRQKADGRWQGRRKEEGRRKEGGKGKEEEVARGFTPGGRPRPMQIMAFVEVPRDWVSWLLSARSPASMQIDSEDAPSI